MYLLIRKPCLSRCLSTLCLLILIEQSLRSQAAGVARTKRGTRTVWKHHHENLVIINNPTNCYCIARWEAIPRKINNLNTQLADGTASVCALALFTVGSWEKKIKSRKINTTETRSWSLSSACWAAGSPTAETCNLWHPESLNLLENGTFRDFTVSEINPEMLERLSFSDRNPFNTGQLLKSWCEICRRA